LHARGDPGLLRSLLGNLLSNAWKFTAGREHARIRFDRRADGAFLVQDNGSGFDPAEAGHLFEPLRRLASSLPCEGTGIGLAVALRIALRHGGRMWAEAQPGEGATFFFTLDD
jgi:signal transduction histidine kinase